VQAVSEQDDDFAALFEASIKTTRRFERGQSIEGTIAAFGQGIAFVSIGGKSEAQIDLNELKDDEGDVEFSVGDHIQAVVVSTTGGITLSRSGVREAASLREVEDAYHAGLAVEGKVEKQVKGGYEVRIAKARAFCPLSQIDIVRTEDPAVHEGRSYTFRITEFKEGGRSIVVSRRRHLEDEQKLRAAEVRASIVPDAVLQGRVASVQEFGAFIDLGGGIQGLLHVSDLSWSRVANPAEVVAVGDPITVKVLKVDAAADRISLGLKQLQGDPWTTVSSTFAVGQVHTGRITRVADFGAFVEIAPGIEALAHASTFPPTGRPGSWKKTVTPGQTATVEILSVDPAAKRIGIALVDEGSARAAEAAGAAATGATASGAIVAGAILTGKVERHEKFGVFVVLAPGRTALMPLAETGLDRDADLHKAFPAGSDIEVVVLDVDSASKRIRVSKKAVAQRQEQAELRDYAQRQASAPSASLGTLADNLRKALSGR
jgi:small subunit ribosomal protein S1